MTAPRYDILATDLDGTLLGPDGRVSPANKAAVERARQAGMLVLPCTGRGLVECRSVLDQFDHAGCHGPVFMAMTRRHQTTTMALQSQDHGTRHPPPAHRAED